MAEEINKRIQQFIHQGESLAYEVNAFRKQGKGVGEELAGDFWSTVAGEVADYITEIPGTKGLVRKYSKKYLAAQRREKLKSMEKAFLTKSDSWLESIKNFLKTVSVKRANLTDQGNSHLLINKFDRVYSYAKPETRTRHTISTLRRIMTYPLIYNTEIPQLLQSERQKRLEEPYQILQKLETKLREYIQTKLETVSKNWWKERVPKDVQEKAELRKTKNEKQWPWHTSKALPLIFYVDFTDYVKIITRRDNWRHVFKEIFKDKEAISVKLRGLEPLRNAIAHFRELSRKEVEKLRLLSEEIVSCIPT
jgi:RecG-like helicase